jgi:transcriptional regulator with XRE-family HTH domain
LRVARGLSQENLAVDAGIDRTYVSRLERGLENPTVGVLEQLAEALAAEIAEFFTVPTPGEPPPPPLRGGRRPKR